MGKPRRHSFTLQGFRFKKEKKKSLTDVSAASSDNPLVTPVTWKVTDCSSESLDVQQDSDSVCGSPHGEAAKWSRPAPRSRTSSICDPLQDLPEDDQVQYYLTLGISHSYQSRRSSLAVVVQPEALLHVHQRSRRASADEWMLPTINVVPPPPSSSCDDDVIADVTVDKVELTSPVVSKKKRRSFSNLLPFYRTK